MRCDNRPRAVLLAVLTCALCAACEHSLEGLEPSISSATAPHLVCNEQLTTPVTLTGDGFSPLPVDTALDGPRLELPRISLELTGDLAGMSVMGGVVEIPDDSSMPENSQVRWLSQMQMVFEVTPELMVPEGIHDVRVVNPNGNETLFENALAVVPPPTLDRVEPMAICVAQGSAILELFGAGFLRIDGAEPQVALLDDAGAVVNTYSPIMMNDCVPLPAPADDAESCGSVVIEIPMEDVPPGIYTIVLTNPEPANCSTTEAITVEVVPPPDLTDVTPARICTGGGTLGLIGEGFRDGAGVTVGDLDASGVVVEPGGMAATATFGVGLLPGTYDLTITNPEGCSDTLVDAVDVVEGPIMFWVDPPVVYSGISTQVTIYVSGASSVDSVELLPSGGGPAVLLMHSFDAARGRILAVVPLGTAAGTYDVRASASGCDTILPGGLIVTDTLTLTIDRIDPEFGHNASATPAAIAGAGFASTPRAYLNPEVPSPTTVARALESVAFVDPSRLTAVVGSGLPVGVYDLIVVNPTGEVGLLEDAFTVVGSPPPVIDFVSPGEVDNDATTTVTATGSGFATPEATWFCRAPDGTITELMGVVVSSDSTSAEVTLPASGLSAETVCVLRLTNPDGSYGEFSAVAVTSPASNLAPTVAGSTMSTARAGLSLVAARATRQARFLHAIGGDAGGTTLSTGESAPVDPFGSLGAWFDQPNGLPGAITDAGAVVLGRQIYLVGGSDGSASLATTWRAEILDPQEAPRITDIAARRVTTETGLGSGIWYYRVSAVMPASHPTNPGGETLASDPLVVNLPTGLPSALVLTLFWSEVTGATEYRVYRSPAPDLASGSEELLATVAAPSREYEDDGSATPSGGSPLPTGAWGEWVSLPSLGTLRSGLGLGMAEDPTTAGTFYLYAIGGDTGSGPVASYELLSITVAGDGTQTVGSAWVAGTTSLSSGRSLLGVYSVDFFSAPASVPLGTSYLYAVGGIDAGGSASSESWAPLVEAGGQLGAFASIDTLNPANAGFAHMAGNGFLYLFGGGPPPPVRSFARSAEVCTGGGCAPGLDNWNAQGFSITVPRYRADGAIESAHLFVVGGETTGGTALSSSESTVW